MELSRADTETFCLMDDQLVFCVAQLYTYAHGLVVRYAVEQTTYNLLTNYSIRVGLVEIDKMVQMVARR